MIACCYTVPLTPNTLGKHACRGGCVNNLVLAFCCASLLLAGLRACGPIGDRVPVWTCPPPEEGLSGYRDRVSFVLKSTEPGVLPRALEQTQEIILQGSCLQLSKCSKYPYTLYTWYLFLNLLCILVYSRVYSHTMPILSNKI